MSAAERMRAFRARQRAGQHLTPVPLDELDLETLIACGTLNAQRADDREARAAAIKRILYLLRVTPDARLLAYLRRATDSRNAT